MEINEFCEKIKLPLEAMANINKLKSLLSLDTIAAQRLDISLENDDATIEGELTDIAKLLDTDIRIVNLYFVVINAIKCKDLYTEKNISDSIYYDTMKDITVWCVNCHTYFGEWGMVRIGWLVNHFRLKLFKLGRLQFRPVTSHEDIQTDNCIVKIGDPVFEVHIPEGEKLEYSKCLESFEKAMDFFNCSIAVFTCESWLLEPSLQSALPDNSNIVLFQKLFTIYHVDKECHQMEERVFPFNNPDDIASFEEKTALQKSIKEKLLAGFSFGSGFGVLRKIRNSNIV